MPHVPRSSPLMQSDGADKHPSQYLNVYVNAGKDAYIRLHANVDNMHQKTQARLTSWQTAHATQDEDYHSTPRQKPGHVL